MTFLGVPSLSQSDDDSDLDLSHPYNNLNSLETSLSVKEPSNLAKQWDAIESTLYRESNPKLPANLAYECKLWSETFLYLRIRGRSSEIHGERKRDLIKDKVLNLVVDNIVDRLNGLQIRRKSAIRVPDRVKKLELSSEEDIVSPKKPQTPGILKYSGSVTPKREKKVNFVDWELKKRSTLPLINEKYRNNRWWRRSERLKLPAINIKEVYKKRP